MGPSNVFRRLAGTLAVAASLSLISLPAHDAQVEPSPGVIAVIDRTEIELSGSEDLGEFLDNRNEFNVYGIQGFASVRGVAYTLDGRRTTGLDLDTLPLSAVERIEIMEESEANISRHAEYLIVNIVLRRSLEGAEASGVVARPALPGRDTHQAGAALGGKVGRGHVLVAVDRVAVQEVREAERDYFRPRWTPGGTFSDSQGVNEGGNTIYIRGLGSRALGDCNPDVYAGVLRDPRGIAGEGCGYAYGDIAFLTQSYERDALFLGVDHPLGDAAHIYLDVLAARTEFHDRYAPTPGLIWFDAPPGSAIRQRLIDDVDDIEESNFPSNNVIFMDHRFLGHGDREWFDAIDSNVLTLGVRGELAGELEYDVRGHHFRKRSHEHASTFVSLSAIRKAVESGDYDIVDPLSTEPRHLDAIRATAVHRTEESDAESNVVRAELAGKASELPGGRARWTAALDVHDLQFRTTYAYRDSQGRSYERSDVLGSGGGYASSSTERKGLTYEAGTNLPVSSNLDLSLNAQLDDIDEVGNVWSWGVAGGFRPNDVPALRAFLGYREGAPNWSDLNAPRQTDFPYVCDTRATPCSNQQVARETGGNPNLEPSERRHVGLRATLRAGAYTLGADWNRIRTKGLPAQFDPQRLVDLDAAGQSLPPGAAVIRDGSGQIARIVSPTLNIGETEAERGQELCRPEERQHGAELLPALAYLPRTSSLQRFAQSSWHEARGHSPKAIRR